MPYALWLLNHMDVCIFGLMELTIWLSPNLVSSLSFVEGIIFLQSSRNTVKVETWEGESQEKVTFLSG